MHYILFIIAFLYAILVINKISFETRIFLLDLQRLKQKGKSEVVAMQTKMIREGTARYASQIADGIVKAVQSNADEEILRRKLKFRHDLINSFFTTITQFFGK
jgi:hypothetical protein